MRCIPPRVAEEQLPWVQVTPYHPHNSVNLPRHLPHITLHLLLWGDGLSHLYIIHCIHCTVMVTTVPLVRFHWTSNAIDNELHHRTINACSLYHKINNFTICEGTFLPNSFFASVNDLFYQMLFVHQWSTLCILVCPDYLKNLLFAFKWKYVIYVKCACYKLNWLYPVHR